jgi:ubiquinone/menaquinone biosynthesis C-methylase UbiE
MRTQSGIGDPYYRTGAGLRTKHLRTGLPVSGRDFVHWALDLLPLSPSSRVLDAGAGWGRFTWPVVAAYGLTPANVTACDASLGMVETLRGEANQRRAPVQLCAAGIEWLPFRSCAFDLVLANHVLYHLTDQRGGVAELARVLDAGGTLLATTNSDAVRVPIIELHYAALRRLGIPFEPEGAGSFSMENGAALLRTAFRRVEVHIFEDEQVQSLSQFLEVYATIGRYQNLLLREDVPPEIRARVLPTVAELAQNLTDATGTLRTPVRMGAFLCREPIGAPVEAAMAFPPSPP